MRHSFTDRIDSLLTKYFGKNAEQVFLKSELLQYINIKTKSASKGSKSRGSFGNLYAIYVLIEDYIKHGFHKQNGYSNYEGAQFSKLLKRQRELHFGSKLQNHALNHRMNEEFKKFFPTCEYTPIIRIPSMNRYWINENLLKVKENRSYYNLAEAVIEIIDSYVEVKIDSFEKFIATCEKLKNIENFKEPENFIIDLLTSKSEARLFEIVSFSILKYYYSDQTVYFGYDINAIEEEKLKLYKTGRANANDGGIDFVMKPIGRFFQVTETTDVKKYFLDIDKIEKFPITFVVKSDEKPHILLEKIKANAEKQYSIQAVVDKYINCIEEIINIDELRKRFKEALELGYSKDILSEIVLQSKVEFNYD